MKDKELQFEEIEVLGGTGKRHVYGCCLLYEVQRELKRTHKDGCHVKGPFIIIMNNR